MEVLRLVPPAPFELLNFQYEFVAIKPPLENLTKENYRGAWEDALKLCLNGLPEPFQNYIRGKGTNFESTSSIDSMSVFDLKRMASSYMAFFKLREMLTEIVSWLEAERRGEEICDWAALPIWFSVELIREEDGFLSVAPNLWQDIFDQRIDSSRLRFCRSCGHVFWVKRNDSEACSTACANILRVRRSRSLSVEEKKKRKAEREANKRYKQRLKELRNKK